MSCTSYRHKGKSLKAFSGEETHSISNNFVDYRVSQYFNIDQTNYSLVEEKLVKNEKDVILTSENNWFVPIGYNNLSNVEIPLDKTKEHIPVCVIAEFEPTPNAHNKANKKFTERRLKEGDLPNLGSTQSPSKPAKSITLFDIIAANDKAKDKPMSKEQLEQGEDVQRIMNQIRNLTNDLAAEVLRDIESLILKVDKDSSTSNKEIASDILIFRYLIFFMDKKQMQENLNKLKVLMNELTARLTEVDQPKKREKVPTTPPHPDYKVLSPHDWKHPSTLPQKKNSETLNKIKSLVKQKVTKKRGSKEG